MNDLYRKTFDEIHASEALRQEVLNMTKQEQAVAKRQIPRMVLIAAIVILVLAGTALAASVPGIRQWLGQQWLKETGRPIHTNQMGMIDQLSDEVGVSAESDGVTVTVDSVTRGEDVFWFLLEVEGLPPEEELEKRLEEQIKAMEPPQPSEESTQETVIIGDVEITSGVTSGLSADLWDADALLTGSRTYSFDGKKASFDPAVSDDRFRQWSDKQTNLQEDGSLAILMQYRIPFTGDAALLNALDVTLEFSNLNWGIYRTAEVNIAEGPWELKFSLPAIRLPKPLTAGGGTALGEVFWADDAKATVWDPNVMGPRPVEEMAFRKIEVSPIALTVFWSDPKQTERCHIAGRNWYLMMADGTEVCVYLNGNMYETLPDGQVVTRYIYSAPLNLDDVQSLEYRYGEEVRAFELK